MGDGDDLHELGHFLRELLHRQVERQTSCSKCRLAGHRAPSTQLNEGQLAKDCYLKADRLLPARFGLVMNPGAAGWHTARGPFRSTEQLEVSPR